jgi:integrase
MINPTPIPTSQQFFVTVSKLDNVLAVHKAVNELLDLFANQYSVATISKKLSEYKKPFYAFQHSDDALNESVETKKGINTQHIAARLLTLSDEQKQQLGVSRTDSDNARAGFDAEGEIREVSKPPVDIKAVIEKSLGCLQSTDIATIAVGVANLTGLRGNEINQIQRHYPDWDTIIERDLIVVSEFVIGCRLSKERSIEDATAYHARVTLAPAQLIVDAHNRFKASPEVKAIGANYEKYRTGFYSKFNKRYSDLFGETLSTIEAFDDDGKITEANGTPHKGRAFYACALRGILKTVKQFKDSAASRYIQLCLAHASTGITIKYLGRYDDTDFVNPIDINIPKSIKGLGKMTPLAVNKAVTKAKAKPKTQRKSKEKPALNTVNLDALLNALSPENQLKLGSMLNSGVSLTDTIISMINAPVKAKSDIKRTVADDVQSIITAIMDYNSQQLLTQDYVIPTVGLINKISSQLWNKQLMPKTVADVLKSVNDDLVSRFTKKEIDYQAVKDTWNGKYHRKSLPRIIDNIVAGFQC